MNFQSQKSDAEMKIAYLKLESLSSQRNELKQIIKSTPENEDHNFLEISQRDGIVPPSMMISTGSSFVSLSNPEMKILLKKKLSRMEDELREICEEIQESFEQKEIT